MKKPKPEWMSQKPGDITKSKEMNGKTYWWCERYEVWAIHKPEDCKPMKRDTPKEKAKSTAAKLVEAAATLEEENSNSE